MLMNLMGKYMRKKDIRIPMTRRIITYVRKIY